MSIIINDGFESRSPKPIRNTDTVGPGLPFATKELIPAGFRYEFMETTDETGTKWRLEGGLTDTDWVVQMGGGAVSWAANTDFKEGQLVLHNGKLYSVPTDYTSSASVATDIANGDLMLTGVEAATQAEVEAGTNSNKYVTSKTLANNVRLKSLFTPTTALEIPASTAANSYIVSGLTGPFTMSAGGHLPGVVVNNGDKITFDGSSWVKEPGGGASNWASGQHYAKGKLVVDGGKLFYVTDTYVSGASVGADLTSGDLVMLGITAASQSEVDAGTNLDKFINAKTLAGYEKFKYFFKPTAAAEYPVPAPVGPVHLPITGLTAPYTFTAGPLAGTVVNNGDVLTFDGTTWGKKLGGGAVNWAAGADLKEGQLVLGTNGQMYSVPANYTSSASIDTDIANGDLTPIRSGAVEYSNGDSYFKGQQMYSSFGVPVTYHYYVALKDFVAAGGSTIGEVAAGNIAFMGYNRASKDAINDGVDGKTVITPEHLSESEYGKIRGTMFRPAFHPTLVYPGGDSATIIYGLGSNPHTFPSGDMQGTAVNNGDVILKDSTNKWYKKGNPIPVVDFAEVVSLNATIDVANAIYPIPTGVSFLIKDQTPVKLITIKLISPDGNLWYSEVDNNGIETLQKVQA